MAYTFKNLFGTISLTIHKSKTIRILPDTYASM